MSLLKIEHDVVLAPHTSWNVGGPAEFFCQPSSVDELREALSWGTARNVSVNVISGGTNILVSDFGIRGLVIALGKLSGITTEERDGRLHLDCLAGTAKAELLKVFLKYQLAPALFLAGLPGDVGGGVVMNAGVGEQIVPREFVELTDWFEVIREIDGAQRVLRFAAKDLMWSYRHCEGWRPGVIARVGLSWPLERQLDILQKVKTANLNRLSKQPLELPSCGSVFVNPPGHKSGQLIEACGLKGFTRGGAQVSTKHANFIVNTGGATADDIKKLIAHVQSTVKTIHGVDLHTEVIWLGEE